MRTRALRPVRQERNRHILGPKLTVIDLYSPLVDTRDRFGKRVGIKFNRFGGCRNGKAKFIDLTSNPHSRSIVWLQ